MHDMKKIRQKETKTQTHTRENPSIDIMIMPKMARVGDTNMESYIRGVTTLLHYERISSQDLGLEKLWIFGTEVILAFPSSFPARVM